MYVAIMGETNIVSVVEDIEPIAFEQCTQHKIL